MTVTNADRATQLAKQFRPQLEKYLAVCTMILADEENTFWDDIHFSGFAMGFFMAEGISPKDAYELSTFCRYRWDGFC